MKERIRDIDLDRVVARIKNAADPQKRTTDDPLIQANIPKQRDPKQAIEVVRGMVIAAILDTAKGPGDLREDDRLVQAFIRTMHHPLSAPMPPRVETWNDVDIAPRLSELAAKHPELVWDPVAVKADLFASIKAHGDHQLDNSVVPWLADWGPAYAWKPLLWFASLEAMGDLPGKVDEHEKGTAEEARKHYEETKHIKPSPLVAPPPPKPPSR